MPIATTPRYFVAEYVNSPINGRPKLLNLTHRHLPLVEAERITNQLNQASGHRIVNEVEIVLSSPTAHYFMLDDDDPTE